MRSPTAITGTAAGVPFTALPPAGQEPGQPAPLIITWHMMDAPCTNAAFAAALPLNAVPAWRVHLGMPWCGARDRPGGREAAAQDPMLGYLAPVVQQATDEFPAALAELRRRLPVNDGPIGVIGGSLGGAVALGVITGQGTPIAAAALVNPAIRARSVVALVEAGTGRPYSWTEQASTAADHFDFVARAEAGQIGPRLLIVSGELDYPAFRTDAADLIAALRERQRQPGDQAGSSQLLTVPGLAHPLAEQPGTEPAPQLPVATLVDAAITEWFAVPQ